MKRRRRTRADVAVAVHSRDVLRVSPAQFLEVLRAERAKIESAIAAVEALA